MNTDSELVWTGGADRIVLSPRAGGRIVSWVHGGEERVHPIVHFEGGLFRVLFAEEQYPGGSYAAPHEIVDWRPTPDGFRAHLRHYWNTPNWFMRAAGWPEKANEFHFDDLLLDKVLTFDRARATFVCELTITNLGRETKYVTPWLHLSFAPWHAHRWVVVNGRREVFRDTEIYWASHLIPPGATAALVHADAAGTLFAVLGTPSDHVRGLASMLPVPGEFLQSSCELRGQTIVLAPGAQYRANSFLALTADWQSACVQPPVTLRSEVGNAREAVSSPDLRPLLGQWMLPEEQERGWMVVSFLDKPPFYSANRFAAAHSFAGFHAAAGGTAMARVMLYAARELKDVQIKLDSASSDWSLNEPAAGPLDLHAHDFVPLTLIGPADLRGKDKVTVSVSSPGQAPVVLRVAPDAQVIPSIPYQSRQGPRYLELRYRDKLGPPPHADAGEIRAWQAKMRQRFREWLEFNAYGACDLDPRLLERQEGPTCVREKWVIQTEPGIFIPGYLIRPRNARGRLPVVYVLHGSGPGKDGYAGDETVKPTQTQFGHELEFMSYGIAQRLNCLVWVPDGRGQGELGETDPGRWTARMEALGVSNTALRLRDQIRALDWLVTRDDVDATRVGSCGCSGGGGLTYLFAAADERVVASIVSSTSAARPITPAPSGWFQRMLLPSGTRIEPHGIEPITGAPMGMLIAPRPMWIVDGRDDLGIPADQRAEWRRTMQQGRDAIRSVYERLDAADRFVDTWVEGGHCAGMTTTNVVAWFRKWFRQ